MTKEEAEEELKRAHEQRIAQHQQMLEAQRNAILHQQELNTYPRQQYAVIVAVDEKGGFSKEGQIPWKYSADFKWFKEKTLNHICVMGRTTYDDLNQRMGDKGEESVLPLRKCFVVTSSELPRSNAIAVKSIGEVDSHLTDEDFTKTVFFIGGERIYREGIAKCQTAYVTVVNKDVNADRHFPVKYLQKHFTMTKLLSVDSEADLRFTIWNRK